MNGENIPIKPKIGDQYWFELSDQLVRNTQQGPAEAADKLQTFVQWLWGFYTTGATVALAVSDQNFSLLKVIFIAAGSIALVAVYWCAAYVQLPVTVEFDPRSPTEIQKAYQFGVAVKNRRLRWTVICSGIAAILISLAIVWDKVSPSSPSTAPWFDASLHVQGGTRWLALTGEIGVAGASEEMPSQNKVIVKIRPAESPAGVKTVESPLVPLGEHGRLQTSLPIDFAADSVYVTLEWTDARGKTIQLSQMVTD
jgi:hypothetical protein